MLSDQTIFLTGFPGFIAGRLVKRLATEGARFLLLVQPTFIARARQDTERIATEAGVSPANFHIVEGDITRADLGLSSAELETARREATMLFHLAALYNLAVPRDIAMRVNVEGTRNVNRLALTLRSLNRYNYVSTCYVAGLRRGVILESELRHEAGFSNFYEETKYLAELETDALKTELPVTIYRPAVVCGDSKTGETAKYDGVYYLINYLRLQPDLLSLANIGNHEARLNIVPVDFIVEAMAALAADERARGATVQLADPNPPTTHDLFEIIAESLSGRRPRVTLPAPLVRSALALPFSEAVTGLPTVSAPYFFANQTFDTARARGLLEPHHTACPAFASYAKVLTDFVIRHPKL